METGSRDYGYVLRITSVHCLRRNSHKAEVILLVTPNVESKKNYDSLFWKENFGRFAHRRRTGLWRMFE